MKRILPILLSLFWLFGAVLNAQVAGGVYAMGSFESGPDTVNSGDLNAHWTVPVRHKQGRGLSFDYDLDYDSSIWSPVNSYGAKVWTPKPSWGWSSATAGATGFLTSQSSTVYCYDNYGHPMGTITTTSNFVYTDKHGRTHLFYGQIVVYGGCVGSGPNSVSSYAVDGSGLFLNVPATGHTTITLPNGVVFDLGVSYSAPTTATDDNGNYISIGSSAGNTVYTDTLGQTALTISPFALSGGSYQQTFSYQDGSGNPSAVTVVYATYPVATKFLCNGVTEYSGTNSLVDHVTLPDGRAYAFTYEPTPGVTGSVTGRIASVTMPGGGTVSYTYTGTNGGIVCADGSAAGLTRVVNDANGNTATTTYTRQLVGSQWQTTINTPESNQILASFLKGIPTGTGISYPPAYFYEVSRTTYTGTISSGTLLQTVNTCYNTNCASPTSVTLPITTRDITILMPNAAGKAYGRTEHYSTLGMPTETDEFDYGSSGTGSRGPLLRKTTTQYASLGQIFDHPSTITVYDGASNVVANTSYLYDTTAVTGTSGTPNHVSGISVGNVTSISRQVSPTSSITQNFSYYDTGLVNTTTDANSGTTTYTYGGCSNSLPTQVDQTTGSTTLTTLATWDCVGGVSSSSTDVNGFITSYSHADPLWRGSSENDAFGNSKTYSYPTTSGNTSESVLAFLDYAGTSVSQDVLLSFDGLGRPTTTQSRRAVGGTSFDTALTIYDLVGRTKKVSIPYTGTAGQEITTASGTTTLYDTLSRPTQVHDSAGGTTTYTYSQNDVLSSIGPAPAGENLKSRQLQYDGIGRITSVCEVTSLTGSGSCAQSVAKTGFYTTYVYTTNLQGQTTVTVTQNAQAGSQVRSFTLDSIGRTLSETNPETGNTSAGTNTYVYDNDSAGACPGTYNGDLVKTTDNAGNVTCYTYDKLHRQLSAKTISGPNSGVTPIRYFVYDNVTVSGLTLQNLKGNLARAYTCTGSCTSKITDVVYSYYPQSVSGVYTGRIVRDMYESTPNSGGYNLSSEVRYPNGTPTDISASHNGASFGFPHVTYGLDAEGRVATAVDRGTSTNLVSATAYNQGSQPTSISFGSGDSDSYTYDSVTRRLNQYSFTGPAYTVTGVLTWNTNGSIGQFQYTDSVDTAKNQTCTFAADDLQRVSSVSCGTPWAQTFSYDPFGNIKKTGTISYLPTSYSATNKPTGIGATFDNNGNMLGDGSNSFAWDAYGTSTSVNSLAVVTDALGRTVEIGTGGTAEQFMYSPSGSHIAVLQGATLIKGLITLPGGAVAVYISSGFAYIRHSDLLGSSRLATRWDHTRYSTTAYAPFGEPYLEAGTQDRSFTGENQDTASGLYDFLYRRYSPSSGRWISPDPAGWSAVDLTNPESLNRYAYVANSPLSQLDPLGLATRPDVAPPVPFDCGWYCIVLEGIPLNGATLKIFLCSMGLCGDTNMSGQGGGGGGGAAPAQAKPKSPNNATVSAETLPACSSVYNKYVSDMNALNAKYASGWKEAAYSGLPGVAVTQPGLYGMANRISQVNAKVLGFIGAIFPTVFHTAYAAVTEEGTERRALASSYSQASATCDPSR